ncbi:hypothetical protein ES703_60441 [subsurface metagenome]
MSPWGEEGAKGEGSDVYAIIIKLGSGTFKFRYVDIVDVNNVKRTMFGVGENVYYSVQFCNDGESKDTATFTITNLGTGQVIKSDVYPNMEPLACGTFSKQKLGVMPNTDWNVEFKVTP